HRPSERRTLWLSLGNWVIDELVEAATGIGERRRFLCARHFATRNRLVKAGFELIREERFQIVDALPVRPGDLSQGLAALRRRLQVLNGYAQEVGKGFAEANTRPSERAPGVRLWRRRTGGRRDACRRRRDGRDRLRRWS